VKIRFIIFAILLLSVSGCLKTSETIKDVVELRQDHAAYFDNSAKVKEPFMAEAQARLDDDYNVIYFSVWHQRQPFYALPERVNLDFIKFGINPGFGENKRRHSKDWVKTHKINAALQNYPNASWR